MDINKQFENLMEDINKNIKDPQDLEYLNKKLSKSILEIMTNINDRTLNLEKKVSKIEEELYITDDENDEYSFEIICPYCNCEFETEINELKTEVTCPECNNVIELDWNEEECGGDCSCCHSDCDHDNEEENEDDM